MKNGRVILMLLVAAMLSACRTTEPTPSPTVKPAAPTATATGAVEGATATAPPADNLKLPDQLSGSNKTLSVYVVDEDTVRNMDVDEYLCGVLAGEMRNDWPAEALKAQAVIARTYLIDFLNSKTSQYSGADISTDEKESQAFDMSGVNDAIRQAVEATKGKVITYEGQAIKAWFYSCSGGMTAMATEGLNYKEGDPPYITVVESDESDAREDALNWSESFTKEEITAALKKMNLTPDTLEPVEITERGPSGRCVTLTFGSTEVNCADLRVNLEPERFRSTLLTQCEWSDGSLKVAGKGFGHGVGMSQWGAYTMAEDGATYEDIINHYFKDVQIVQAWE